VTCVLVTGIGGSIGVDVARSLRRDPSIRVIGGDASPWGVKIGERLCDAVVRLPRSDRDAPGFVDAIDRVVAEHGVDLAFVNPDFELAAVATAGRAPRNAHPLPPPAVIGASLDKSATVAAVGKVAELPRSLEVTGAEGVARAFAELGSPLWLRCSIGAGGKGAIQVASAAEAAAWIGYWTARGWTGRWLFQEFLPGRNLNWTGLYVRGELRVTAAMERLRYFLGDAAPSGVSGQVSLCATVDPRPLAAISDRVVRALDPAPHGLYSVDLREDASGAPRVTEVNPRLAGRPWLYTNAGVNLPLATVRAMLDRPLGDALAEAGLALGLHLYRQLDVEPTIGYPEAP
jgi:carbamoyl-phosphate synthase large subunit